MWPTTIVAKTGSEAYVELLGRLYNGKHVSPRGNDTLELLNTTVHIEDGNRADTLATSRKINLGIAAVETLHLLGGLSSLEQLDLASKGRFTQFADNGRLKGAYGPRAFLQLHRVHDLLKRDPTTRQAVVTLWVGKEHESSSRDVPCTQSLQFLVRDGKLHLRVQMRSSDAFLGIPYDWLMFSRLLMVMARSLRLPVGSFTHTAASQHLYLRDREASIKVIKDEVWHEDRLKVPALLTPDSFVSATALARMIAMSGRDAIVERWHDAVDFGWYFDHVPLVTDVKLCRACRYVLPLDQMRDGVTCTMCAVEQVR